MVAAAAGELRPPPPVVVGVARGGVAVAAEVARTLAAELTAIDVERVNARGRRLGATSAAGPAYIVEGHGLPDEELAAVVERARAAARAVDARLEHDVLPVAGRDVLVADDGVITGLTLAAACRWARGAGATSVIAAAPVAHPGGIERLRVEADVVLCPHVVAEIAVVGQAYDIFDPLDEWYVAGLLRAEQEPEPERGG